MIKEYGHENPPELSVEVRHSYLHNTIIKSLVMECLEGKETSNSEFEEEKFQQYGLMYLCHSTTPHWMWLLGFWHEPL
jgi:hypothetical protein